MAALKDILKKVGGVVTGVASVAAKAVPGVGNLISGALSNVSSKLLASPTPQKEAAAALTAGVAPTPSTPIKESSISLQAGLAPVASTLIKQASYDLTGTKPASVSGSVGKKALPSSPLMSMIKESAPVKKATDIINNISGASKKASTGLYILIGALVVMFGIIIFATKKRRR